MSIVKCGECRFCNGGFCKRYPPVLIFNPAIDDINQIEQCYPLVARNDWCGEGKKKPQESKGCFNCHFGTRNVAVPCDKCVVFSKWKPKETFVVKEKADDFVEKGNAYLSHYEKQIDIYRKSLKLYCDSIGMTENIKKFQ